jgi:hypothetical protein
MTALLLNNNVVVENFNDQGSQNQQNQSNSEINVHQYFVQQNFKEDLTILTTKSNLIYYISSFDKSFIDLQNYAFLNHIDAKPHVTHKNIMTMGAATNRFKQEDGLLIDFQDQMVSVTPFQIDFNHTNFTIVTYVKFDITKNNFDGKSVYLIHIPLNQNYTLIGLNIVFRKYIDNPDVELHWMNSKLTNSFIYADEDTNKLDKNLHDQQYHMISIKKEGNKITVLLDDNVLFFDNSDVPEQPSWANWDNKMTNEAVISINKKYSDQSSAVSLNCKLNSLAIFNKTLAPIEISELLNYYKSIKYKLNPFYTNIQENINVLKNNEKCPFSTKSLCYTTACSNITDWNDISTLLNNEDCFKNTVDYCNQLSNYDNDKKCMLFDKDNILKSASRINNNSNLLINSDENEELLAQLRKIGLNNIHLDKSLRATGKYGEEINQLIEKISLQKRLNLKGIQDQFDFIKDPESPSEIRYDNLLNTSQTNSSSKDSSSSKISSDENQQEKKSNLGIINLEYNDLESYDKLISDFENEKQKENTLVEPNKGLFYNLTSWL